MKPITASSLDINSNMKHGSFQLLDICLYEIIQNGDKSAIKTSKTYRDEQNEGNKVVLTQIRIFYLKKKRVKNV